jgi:hypothetical protein
MQTEARLYPALFTTRVGALTAVIRASSSVGVPKQEIATRGRAQPVYKRGELLGYRAVYPRPDGGFGIVRETYDGSQKCYHFN